MFKGLNPSNFKANWTLINKWSVCNCSNQNIKICEYINDFQVKNKNFKKLGYKLYIFHHLNINTDERNYNYDLLHKEREKPT